MEVRVGTNENICRVLGSHNGDYEEFYLLGYNTMQSITLVSCLAYSVNVKMKATCSCETLADFQTTTRRYIPE
jgi:hypothetical protein